MYPLKSYKTSVDVYMGFVVGAVLNVLSSFATISLRKIENIRITSVRVG